MSLRLFYLLIQVLVYLSVAINFIGLAVLDAPFIMELFVGMSVYGVAGYIGWRMQKNIDFQRLVQEIVLQQPSRMVPNISNVSILQIAEAMILKGYKVTVISDTECLVITPIRFHSLGAYIIIKNDNGSFLFWHKNKFVNNDKNVLPDRNKIALIVEEVCVREMEKGRKVTAPLRNYR